MILSEAFLGLLWVGLATSLPQQPSSPSSICSPSTNCLSTTPLPPRFFPSLQPQRYATTYGPFTVPPSTTNHGMQNYRFPIAPPCTDCFVTHLQADLQYPNGTTANANTGLWLHHIVIANLNRSSSVCPRNAENVFAAGNERTPSDISLGGTQRAGYYIAPGTVFYFSAELMNANGGEREAVVVMDWEWVGGASVAGVGFKAATPLWLDIEGVCPPTSEVPVPENGTAKVFSLEMSPPWKATFAADVVLFVGSHLHDGGETLQVVRNGKTVCDSVARYGESEGYVDVAVHEHGTGTGTGGGGGHGVEERAPAHTTITTHISSMSTCSFPQLQAQGIRVEVGDEWSIRANYNLTNHKAMGEGSHLEPIMGISMVYVVKNGQ